jgi:hypothetical protein
MPFDIHLSVSSISIGAPSGEKGSSRRHGCLSPQFKTAAQDAAGPVDERAVYGRLRNDALGFLLHDRFGQAREGSVRIRSAADCDCLEESRCPLQARCELRSSEVVECVKLRNVWGAVLELFRDADGHVKLQGEVVGERVAVLCRRLVAGSIEFGRTPPTARIGSRSGDAARACSTGRSSSHCQSLASRR